MNPLRLNDFARRWRRWMLARESLLALGAAGALAALALALAPGRPALALLAAGVGFGAALAGRLALARPWRLDAAELGRHLDRTYPELEESSALWLRAPAGLTTLERLQRRRLDAAFARLEQGAGAAATVAGPPRGFLRSALVWAGLGAAALATVGGWAAGRRAGPVAAVSNPGPAPARQPAPPATAAPKPGWPRVADAELVIAPPAYTGRPERRVAALDAAEIEEGARVSWRLGLDRAPGGEVRLVFGEGAAAGGEALPLTPDAEGRFAGQRVLTDSALYHLGGSLPDGSEWSAPEVHSLKVRKDAPPTLAILEPAAPRTVVEPTLAGEAEAATPPPPTVRVEVLAGDDFGVAEAWLVATVAKGSGEAVKFREQAIAFEVSEPAAGLPPHGRRLAKTLDLSALGLERGDELYFYAEARDNREPTPNRTRSETRFVTLRGPASAPAEPGRGVAGVNLVPQYFRSQRQIILDTEKLLADQPALADAEFRRRANDLGHDQALLRLRYGQFLGEEREEGAGDHPELNLNPLQPGVPAGVPADLVHRHDRAEAPEAGVGASAGDPRAGLRTAMRLRLEHERQAREGGGHDDGATGPATGLPPAPGQILAPFVDQHDSQEKATFFDGELKGTLREALGAMWEAEKFLRVARPREALGPENRALEILKALQQSARSYVQRVGFEPPPLKIAERRGRGDVSEVRPKELAPGLAPVSEGALAAVRAALRAGRTGTEALRGAEPALTAVATRQPEEFLEALGALRRLGAGGSGSDADWPVLERALWKLLPPGEPRPRRAREVAPSLAEAYFRALETGEAGGQ